MKKTLIALFCTALLLFGVFEIRLTAQPQPAVETVGLPAVNQETEQRHFADTLTQSPVESVDLDQDDPQPQVLIEARVISATPNFARDIVTQFGFVLGNNPGGIFVDLPLLDAAITTGESKGLAKLIAHPILSTKTNTSAALNIGIRYPVQVIRDNTIQVKFYDTALEMEVTPGINQDDDIFLDMKFTNTVADFSSASTDGVPATRTSEISTRVMVNDGGTTVLGGIVMEDKSLNEIRELLYFITPTIVR